MNDLPKKFKAEIIQVAEEGLKALGHRITIGNVESIDQSSGTMYQFDIACDLCKKAIQGEINEAYFFTDEGEISFKITIWIYSDYATSSERIGLHYSVPDSNNARFQLFSHSFREFRIISGKKEDLYCQRYRAMI